MLSWILFFLSGTSQVGVDRPDSSIFPQEIELQAVIVTPDVIHNECLFDSCYAMFVKVASPLYEEEAYVKDDRKKDIATIPYQRGYQPDASNFFYLRAIKRARMIEEMYRNLHSAPSYDKSAEKEKFVRQLVAFRDTASALPVVYADIQTKYGGDVRAYVDDLFARSALTDRRWMKRLTRSPSLRKLQRDMGFQFAVAKLLYLSWELRGRPQDEAFRSFVPNDWRTVQE